MTPMMATLPHNGHFLSLQSSTNQLHYLYNQAPEVIMTHTLDTILDYVHSIVRTHAQYAKLPQDIRDLYEEAQEIEYKRQMEWNELCRREDERKAKEAEEARLQAIWHAVDNGSSCSPNGTW